MILIINQHGLRLCQDDRWRSHAHFGTTKQCVRVYKLYSAAATRARRVNGSVVVIPDGMEVDASGRVMETIPVKDAFHQILQHDLSKFIVTLKRELTPPIPKKTPVQKLVLIRSIYLLAYEHTQSFELDAVFSASLSYLLGAIATDDQFDARHDSSLSGNPLIVLLRNELPTWHPIWHYVLFNEKDYGPTGNPASASSRPSE
jgi:hypothetical protein